jgi:putative nucleotidyltransferase-like protein
MNASLEQQCLLLLARSALTAEEQGRAGELLAEPLAWPVVAQSADEHGVLPLVTRNLRRLGWPHVPDATRTQLERAEYLNLVRNRLLARGLGTILGRFIRAGIPVIALKGVALAESLYGEVSLRVCSDLDVLVPGHAVGRAIELLRADGFRDADRYQARVTEIDLLLRSNMEYCLVSPPPGFQYLVELHWDIAWRWRADSEMVDHLWAEARPGTVLGTEAWVLSPEWELLYLAFHAARHHWSALKWLVDVHETCVRGGFDWTVVQDHAGRFGLERALYLTLGTCRALLGTPLPPAIAQHAPLRTRALRAAPEAVGGWQESLSAAWLLSRPLDRLRYLGRLLLGPTLAEWSLVRFPSRLRFLYHGLRPLRLGLASGSAIVSGTKLLGFLARAAHTPRSTDGS